ALNFVFRLAPQCVCQWSRFTLGCRSLSVGRSGPSSPDGPYGEAPSLDDRRSPVNTAGRTSHRAVARSPTAARTICFGAPRAKPAGALLRSYDHSSCVLLVRIHGCRDRVAYSFLIRTRDAVGAMAQGRTREFSGSRPSLLVACDPTLVERRS